jgi:hypothetical protein
LNLQPMDNEREYLPWMSDCLYTQSSLHFILAMHLLTIEQTTICIAQIPGRCLLLRLTGWFGRPSKVDSPISNSISDLCSYSKMCP